MNLMPQTALADADMPPEIARRRTFAIISHPDAGKTTLTEKLLLFGGAIQMAGAVKARGERRRTRSDWMQIEQQRGISVTSSVMTFERNGIVYNLLDTPGHSDFSEDTYRTLSAVDAAVMVMDAAKGIESQTRKLFEVCRLRDIPIITFINKIDREAEDPLTLLDQIASDLALDLVPMGWPVGMGTDFRGVLDLVGNKILLPESASGAPSTGILSRSTRSKACAGSKASTSASPTGRSRVSSSRKGRCRSSISKRFARGICRQCSSAARSRISASSSCSMRLGNGLRGRCRARRRSERCSRAKIR